MRSILTLSFLRSLDWPLFGASVLLTLAGIVTMNTFGGDNIFFVRQLMWASVSIAVFLFISSLDVRFLRRTGIIISIYVVSIVLLILLLVVGEYTLGAKNRFDLGIFSFQPSDPIQLVLILLLAKYFSRRHVEIANIRHILISGAYTFGIFGLMFLQPDFGSAIIIGAIWFGMVLVSGISKRHVAMVFVLTIVAGLSLWFFAFEDYQKKRIISFLNPLTDIQGSGYNAYQSTIAVGSGELWGKGIGYGTQSKLQFLPEYETDFIFAAFAEEWGFVGTVLLLLLFGIVVWRILAISQTGASNFEVLYGAGLAVMFMSHAVVHAGMNMGLLPVTGTTIPFLSYGGSHLISEFAGLGILMAMHRYSRVVPPGAVRDELYLT